MALTHYWMYDLGCLLCNPIALNLVEKAVEFTCKCPPPDLIGLILTTVISIVFPITVFTIFTILTTFDAAIFTIFPTLLPIYLPSCSTICTVYTILFVWFATRANMSGVPRRGCQGYLCVLPSSPMHSWMSREWYFPRIRIRLAYSSGSFPACFSAEKWLLLALARNSSDIQPHVFEWARLPAHLHFAFPSSRQSF